jgi:subtilisin family serine protease
MKDQHRNSATRHQVLCVRSGRWLAVAILIPLCAIFVLHGLDGHAAADEPDPCDQLAGLISERMMARTHPGIPIGDFIAALQQMNPEVTAAYLESIPNRPVHLLSLDLPPWWGDDELDAFEEQLKTQYEQYLAWGELLYDAETPEGKTGSTFLDRPIMAGMFTQQYAAEKLGLEGAHQRATGLGVVVAVVDTGVDASHPLFEGRIAPGGYNFIDNNTNTNDDGSGSMVGHGTFVAGLVLLVAPEAKILPVRVLDPEGEGTLWTLAQGMFHAIDRGVEVINVSVASTYKSEAVEDAVKEARSLGIVVTAAAGNCNQDRPREFPAMQSKVFGVASLDEMDIKAGFSNFSDRLFVSAPGNMALDAEGEPDPNRSIISAHPSGVAGNYVYWQGTSMSAPLVAGAVALIRAQNPQWPPTESTLNAIEAIIEESAFDIDELNPDYEGELGVGRIDAAAATLMGPLQPALGDLNNDGVIDVLDLIILLDHWGRTHSSADLNGDGTVDVLDLLVLLDSWG